MVNLDKLCFDYATRLTPSDDTEKIINNSLGVLQGDGIFALFLYLYDKKINLAEWLIGFLASSELKGHSIHYNRRNNNKVDFYNYLKDNIASDLDALILTKELLERVLTYARYHVKA